MADWYKTHSIVTERGATNPESLSTARRPHALIAPAHLQFRRGTACIRQT
jgi:hypothetical protein